jgi:hypothetical protein
MRALENAAGARHASVVHRHAVRLLLWIPDILPLARLQGDFHIARIAWLIAILLLGNIAMSSYMLLDAFPSAGGCERLNKFLRRKS